MTSITPVTPIALTVSKNEARADSRLLADHLGLKHKSVLQTINDHRTSFEMLGKVRFENAASTDSTTGQRMRFALLNEDQAYFLLTMSRNTPRVVGLKLELVKAFRGTRLALAAYQEGTLPSFKGLQDALQVIPGGPGPWLFSNINKMINATAGVAAGTRAQCAAAHQALLTYLQGIATQAVAGAKDAKDAYHRVKETLRPFGSSALAITA
jgi:hypothetical protein